MRRLLGIAAVSLLLSGCTTVTYNCNVANSCVSDEAARQAD